PPEGGDRFIVKLEEVLGAPASVAGCSGCDAPKAGTPPVEAAAPAAELPTSTPAEGTAVVAAAPAPVAPAPRPAPPPRQERHRPAPKPVEKPETQKIDTAQQRKIEEETKTQTRIVSDPIPMWIYVAKKAEIEQGKAIVADLGGPKVAVFNVDGIFHVLTNECGHQGGPLGEGKLEGFSVVCPWHQW